MYKTTKQNIIIIIIIIIIAVLRGHLIIIIIFQVGAGGQHIDLDGTLELVVGKIFGAHQEEEEEEEEEAPAGLVADMLLKNQ
jgi:flagellar basal body-associated protein FliL